MELLGAERVVLAVVADHDGLLEGRDHLVLDDLPRRVGGAAADVDARDLDPGSDLVLLGIVIGPDANSEQESQRDQRREGDQDLVVHVQSCAHLRVVDQLSPTGEFYVSRPPGPAQARFATPFAVATPAPPGHI